MLGSTSGERQGAAKWRWHAVCSSHWQGNGMEQQTAMAQWLITHCMRLALAGNGKEWQMANGNGTIADGMLCAASAGREWQMAMAQCPMACCMQLAPAGNGKWHGTGAKADSMQRAAHAQQEMAKGSENSNWQWRVNSRWRMAGSLRFSVSRRCPPCGLSVACRILFNDMQHCSDGQ